MKGIALLPALALTLAACGSVAPLPGANDGGAEDARADDAAADAARDASGAVDTGIDLTGQPCTTDAQCGGLSCAYAVADRCAAKGKCTAIAGCPEGANCGPMPEPACGCDGKPVPYLDGGTYVRAPVRGPNACGANDPQKCTTEATCGNDELCVFGWCTPQCMDSTECYGGTGKCDHTQCYGPHGCNPPPPGQGCPPVCMGVCTPGIGGEN